MKTLIIFAVILGVLFLFFVVKAEKSFVIKGNEVVPGGIDIPKLILDKAKEVKFQAIDNKNIQTLSDSVIDGSGSLINKIKVDAKDLASEAFNKISELVKDPIENKINDSLCPQK